MVEIRRLRVTRGTDVWYNLGPVWNSFIARLDLAQLLTNLLIVSSTGFLAGKFGVRRALEQARKERAFDRTLEWHESTLRMIKEFRFLNRRYSEAVLRRETFLKPDKAIAEFAKQLEKCASDLVKMLGEAALFAEKKRVSQLSSAAKDLAEIICLATKVANAVGMSVVEEFDLLKQLRLFEGVTVSIHVALVQEMRKQLGLDRLTASDLGLGPEPARSEKIRGLVLTRFPFAVRLFPRMFPQYPETR